MKDDHYQSAMDKILSMEDDSGKTTDAGSQAIAYGLALLADAIDNAANTIANTMSDTASSLRDEISTLSNSLSSISVYTPDGVSVLLEKDE